MLQKKEYQQQQRYQVTPTKTNATKEGLPTTTPTIKKSIVENQTSGKIKTNVTKEGIPTTTTNVTKQEITNNNKDTNNTDKN